MSILNNAIAACTEEIDRHKGKLIVKEAPRAVSFNHLLLKFVSFQSFNSQPNVCWFLAKSLRKLSVRTCSLFNFAVTLEISYLYIMSLMWCIDSGE